MVREVSVLLAAVVGAVLVLALLDYGLRLPSTVRMIAWVAGLVAVGVWVGTPVGVAVGRVMVLQISRGIIEPAGALNTPGTPQTWTVPSMLAKMTR